MNYWPVQLGNYWNYQVTEPTPGAFLAEYDKWVANFQGNSTGVRNPGRTCTSIQRPNDLIGSKVSTEVMPSLGTNRFNSSRFIQFYKEKGSAYHGPKYCNIINNNAENSWNLQWYIKNPFFIDGKWWLGSEGGMRMARTVFNGSSSMASNQREWKSQVYRYGDFPKDVGFNSGAGRFPGVLSTGSIIPGYTYLPLSDIPNLSNTSSRVVSDFVYNFKMGLGYSSHIQNRSTYLNDNPNGNRILWEMEYTRLKASDVLRNYSLVGANTEVLSIIFFEPYFRGVTRLSDYDEMACENWYFVNNVGLVKLTHNIVAVIPGDDANLTKTRQLCYYQFKDVFQKSLDAVDRTITFSDIQPYLADIDNKKYSYPNNTFEITSFMINQNSNQDVLGFHSPDAATVSDYPQPGSVEYYSNGLFWDFYPNGLIWAQGNLESVWKGNSYIKGHIDPNGTGTMIYPWTNKGPDAIENGSDIQLLFNNNSIVINDGVYWFRNPGSTTPNPFSAPSGYIKDLFPGYYSRFGNDTNRLGVAVTGFNQVFIQKDGRYLYYGLDASNHLTLKSEGWNRDLPKWQQAPKISGSLPFEIDTMMYGSVMSPGSAMVPTQQPISNKQLILFQQGKVWVKYGYSGEFEKWLVTINGTTQTVK